MAEEAGLNGVEPAFALFCGGVAGVMLTEGAGASRKFASFLAAFDDGAMGLGDANGVFCRGAGVGIGASCPGRFPKVFIYSAVISS